MGPRACGKIVMLAESQLAIGASITSPPSWVTRLPTDENRGKGAFHRILHYGRYAKLSAPIGQVFPDAGP